MASGIARYLRHRRWQRWEEKFQLERSPLDDPARPRFAPLPPDKQTPVFVVGTGRSGTHFLARLFRLSPAIASFHETTLDNAADSFSTYVKWYDLNIDLGSLYDHRHRLIAACAENGWLYLESNAYASFFITAFYNRHRAKFIHLHREPRQVVNSYFRKGWYQNDIVRNDLSRIAGYQYGMLKVNHALRVVPQEPETFARWQNLTRIGKISWLWNEWNKRILQQLAEIPPEQFMSVELDTLDYQKYVQIHQFIHDSSPITENTFAEIQFFSTRRGHSTQQKSASSWSSQEEKEFLEESREVRQALGYSDR